MLISVSPSASGAAINIKITSRNSYNDNYTYTYNQAGQRIASVAVPDSPRGYDQLHDLVIDKNGNTQVIYGGPYLATHNGSSWSFHPALNWTLFGVTYTGAVATFENYVYAQSQEAGPANGIIRFDTANSYTASLFRISNGSGGYYEPQDVTMGMDGWLYVNVYKGGIAGHGVYKLDPNTMNVVGSVTLTYGDRDGHHTVVDNAGNIYAMGYGNLNKYSPSGTFIKSIVLDGHGDLDISNDGKLLTMQDHRAIILDTELNVLTFFDVQGPNWGEPFVTWDTYQAPAPTPEPGMGLLGVGVGLAVLGRRRAGRIA